MEPTSVVSIITDAVANVTADAMPVIAAGAGLSFLFWGAKFLISKFKGVTK